MPLEYVKLANVTTQISTGDLTSAALLAAMTAGETIVVNVKGRILTVAEMQAHLAGTVDGETVVRADGIPCSL